MSERRRKLEQKGERQTRLEERPAFGTPEPPSGGRAGGNMARDLGTRADAKAARERPTSRTTEQKSDEPQE